MLIDWVFADFDTYGRVIGGLVSLFAGLGLRVGVRIEVAQADRPLQDRIDSLIARELAEIGRSATPPPAARAAAEETVPVGTQNPLGHAATPRY